jgi:putative acetyltransferase
MIKIRPENEDDFLQVFRVNALAFETEAEAKLVEKLRAVESVISLVAEADGNVIGHILFSPMTFEDQPSDFLGLAPMAVAPEFQNQGVGSQLVREGLRVAAERGATAVFVLGHPGYYPRFGFETARSKGFYSEYDVPEEVFMVSELEPGAVEGKEGLVKYRPEFAEV